MQFVKPKHNVISAHTVRLEDVDIVTKCKFTFAISFKLSVIKKLAKNERFTVLRHFCTVSFKLSLKNKTGNSQRVRDKTYKVVNLISRCFSIKSMDISMDLSMDIHIHGKPGYRDHIGFCENNFTAD